MRFTFFTSAMLVVTQAVKLQQPQVEQNEIILAQYLPGYDAFDT